MVHSCPNRGKARHPAQVAVTLNDKKNTWTNRVTSAIIVSDHPSFFCHMTHIDETQPGPPLSAEHRSEMESLLHPIREDLPTGPPIRFDPIFDRLREARREDDQSLPMGVWEQSPKRADWAQTAALCEVTLRQYAKDLQVAAWLTEAWTFQHGFEGLLRGLLLVEGLLVRFWDTVHPQVDEDGDPWSRVAPLEWMNSALATTIRIHVPVLGQSGEQLGRFSLADWERMPSDALSPAAQQRARRAAEESGQPLQPRADVVDDVKLHRGADAERSLQQVRHCVAAVLSIGSVTEARLGGDAPDMSRLRDTLRAVERVLLQLGATGEPGVVSRDATQERARLGAVGGNILHEEAIPDDAARTSDTSTGEVSPPDAAQLLGRRIDAICKAAGIHAPGNAERLMAMQIGLLHDQNTILQGATKGAAGQLRSQAGADAACGDFTALLSAVLSGAAPTR
jgi:type VI secretion system protein ImpA